VDAVCGTMIEAAERQGKEVIIVSEYGITPATDAVHINRVLREAGLIEIKVEMGTEQLDAGLSRAFALADHQLAHVYVNDPGAVAQVKQLLEGVDGIDQVLDEEGKKAIGLDHPRSGELVAIADRDRWFSYYFWLDEQRAPDYARTVDIHRKPGYDPVELFIDPGLRVPALTVGAHVLKTKLGIRSLMRVVSLHDTALVKGTHGRLTDDPEHGPLVISSRPDLLPERALHATAFKDFVLQHVFG